MHEGRITVQITEICCPNQLTGFYMRATLTLNPHVLGNLRTNLIQSTCDVFHDLVPFVQLKKREKHQWRSVTNTP